jgi:hypothetical protein
MKATSAQYVGVLSKAALGRMDDHDEEGRRNNLSSGLPDVGYCFGTECVDRPGNRSRND